MSTAFTAFRPTALSRAPRGEQARSTDQRIVPKDAYWVASDRISILSSGKDSHGTLAVFELWVSADPELGPPPHAHTDCDECFFVTQGTLKVLLGETWLVAGPGDFLRVPRGMTHTFRNIGGVPARAIVTVSPAGLDDFFRRIGVPVTESNIDGYAPTKLDIERMLSNIEKYKMELRGMPE